MNCTIKFNQKEYQKNYEIKNTTKYNTKHHTPNGFKNPYLAIPRSFWKSFFWITNKILSGEEKEKIYPVEGIPISKEEISKKANSYQFWWIGHSTVYIKTPEFAFITDPQFSKRASPVAFFGPIRHALLPIEIEDLPEINFVLISHNHYDHLDQESIKRIYKKFKPIFFVPLKVGNLLKEWNIENIIELDWWQYIQIQDFEIYCTPARHFSARSLFDRNETLWSGWFVKDLKNQFSFYFAGDTGYENFFKEIREEIGKPNLAMIPIGAFEPRWFMKEVHIDPIEAVQAYIDLEADIFFPIHWGTFYLAEEPMNLPPILLKQEIIKRNLNHNQIKFLKIGEKVEIFLSK